MAIATITPGIDFSVDRDVFLDTGTNLVAAEMGLLDDEFSTLLSEDLVPKEITQVASADGQITAPGDDLDGTWAVHVRFDFAAGDTALLAPGKRYGYYIRATTDAGRVLDVEHSVWVMDTGGQPPA